LRNLSQEAKHERKTERCGKGGPHLSKNTLREQMITAYKDHLIILITVC